MKYCDDVTVQEVININTALACNIDRSGPLPWWESSGKVLPKGNSLLQTEIESLKRISDNREMILNAKKTCLFVVNFTENHQFRPLLALPGESDALQVVFETKLLGYWLTSDMKPSLHVEFIVKKCISRLWTIRQLKKTGVCNTDITKFYTTMIRSVLETNCVVFNSMLTQQEDEDIERVQRTVTMILLGPKFTTYEEACIELSLPILKIRRSELSLKFALRCLDNPKFSSLFVPVPEVNYSIRNREKYIVPMAATERYKRSPLVYLTTLLNNYFKQSEIV